ILRFLSHTNDRTWRRCPGIPGTPVPEKQNAKSEDTGKSQKRGMQSAEIEREVYIADGASEARKKEGEGPLGEKFDIVCQDPMFGQDSWEMAESTMQAMAAKKALEKGGLNPSAVRCVFAGDLLAQLIATSF